MKKLFVGVTVFLAHCCSLSAGQYVGLHGGSDYGFRTDSGNSGQKVGYQIGGTYGYDWGNQIRTEIEMSYREGHKTNRYVVEDDKEKSKEHSSVHTLCYMLNACYDISQLTYLNVVPFAGVGVGYGQNTEKMKLQSEGKVSSVKEHDDRFAWQVIAGAKYPLTDKTELAAKYNYWCGHEHAKNHSFSLGLVRSF